MTTTATQIADERRLYEAIEQRHHEALVREQIRMARTGRPSGVGAILSRTRMAIREMVSSKPSGRPVSYEPIQETMHDAAGPGRGEQPAGSAAGH